MKQLAAYLTTAGFQRSFFGDPEAETGMRFHFRDRASIYDSFKHQEDLERCFYLLGRELEIRQKLIIKKHCK